MKLIYHFSATFGIIHTVKTFSTPKQTISRRFTAKPRVVKYSKGVYIINYEVQTLKGGDYKTSKVGDYKTSKVGDYKTSKVGYYKTSKVGAYYTYHAFI